MARTAISNTDAFKALTEHAAAMAPLHMRDLFAEDPARAEKFRLSAGGLTLDYSKNIITTRTMRLLMDLTRTAQLDLARTQLFGGEKVNATEDRPALHTALRDHTHMKPEVKAALDKMKAFADGVRSGEIKGATGEKFTDIISIGIGGSYLGPAMAVTALAPTDNPGPWVTFVSNVDGGDLSEALAGLNPDTTLFVVQSKSFGTEETLANATTARQWLVDRLGEEAVPHHFAAVSANVDKTDAFAIPPGRVFPMWDWVGGRYSMWSAAGLPIALGCGFEVFEGLLKGAEEMDIHFRTAKPEANIPAVLGALAFWYTAFFNAPAHAVLPYAHRLRLLPAHLQQLCMESLGKSVRRDGGAVDWPTGEIVFGEAGTNGQHSFYQLMHQGTVLVPSDIIVALRPDHDLGDHHDRLVAHALAQGEAFMTGRTRAEVEDEMKAAGNSAEEISFLAPHRTFAGNRPSNTIVMDRLTPKTLGALVALYEHKVFVQSVLMDINAFDQWGVELGKSLAGAIEEDFAAGAPPAGKHDGSTQALIEMYLAARDRS